MAFDPPQRNQILAATAEQCTLVMVAGAATFRLAPAFKQATQAARLAGSAFIVVDMAACTSMDSTFMGALASFGFAFQKSESPAFVLINMNPNAAALLKGLGVDRILKIYPAGTLPAGLGNLSALAQNLRPVEAAAPGAHDLAALMYDAHETLTRVDPENLQRFKDVLTYLREDLKRP